ncbi:MAG: hypothetical protein II894_01040, partial [Bacteroidales bacterium]|nr:hypothetical protein [Bacteroidales bacterium]
FRNRATVLTKLLSYSMGNKILNVAFMFAFGLNFACLGSTVSSLTQQNLSAIYTIVGWAVVLVGLIVFIPSGREEKAENPGFVFVSGISYIGNFNREQAYNSFGLSLVPLVRMFQLFEEGLKDSFAKGMDNYRNCQFLVVLSDAFTPRSNNTLRDVMHVVDANKEDAIDDGVSIEDNLRLVIREVIKKEFPLPEGEWAKKFFQTSEEWTTFIDNVKIDFTEAINYNKDFDTAYNRIEEKVDPLDDENHELYFNLTPGTSIIDGILSLFAIDGDRKLYIYGQAKPSAEEVDTAKKLDLYKRNLLKPIVKSRIPLNNLLSQAIESDLAKK